jgi:hypothetical protein
MHQDGVSVSKTVNNSGKQFNLTGKSIVVRSKNTVNIRKVAAGVYIRENKNKHIDLP